MRKFEQGIPQYLFLFSEDKKNVKNFTTQNLIIKSKYMLYEGGFTYIDLIQYDVFLYTGIFFWRELGTDFVVYCQYNDSRGLTVL